MLAVTPVALVPVFAALMRSRRSVSLSVASTWMATPLMLKLPTIEPGAWPRAVPKSVVRLLNEALPTLCALATRRPPRGRGGGGGARAGGGGPPTPTSDEAADGVLPSVRPVLANACFALK